MGHSSHIQRIVPKCGGMKLSRTLFIAIASAAMISLSFVGPAAAQGRLAGDTECLSGRLIQSAIESGKIQSWPRIKKMAGISAYEEVSDVQVCLLDGVPFYVLNVISPNGEAMKIALNAVDGTEEVL